MQGILHQWDPNIALRGNDNVEYKRYWFWEALKVDGSLGRCGIYFEKKKSSESMESLMQMIENKFLKVCTQIYSRFNAIPTCTIDINERK